MATGAAKNLLVVLVLVACSYAGANPALPDWVRPWAGISLHDSPTGPTYPRNVNEVPGFPSTKQVIELVIILDSKVRSERFNSSDEVEAAIALRNFVLMSSLIPTLDFADLNAEQKRVLTAFVTKNDLFLETFSDLRYRHDSNPEVVQIEEGILSQLTNVVSSGSIFMEPHTALDIIEKYVSEAKEPRLAMMHAGPALIQILNNAVPTLDYYRRAAGFLISRLPEIQRGEVIKICGSIWPATDQNLVEE